LAITAELLEQANRRFAEYAARAVARHYYFRSWGIFASTYGGPCAKFDRMTTLTPLGEKLLQLTAIRRRRILELDKRLRPSDGHLAGILQCHLLVESLLEELIHVCLGQYADAVLSAKLTFDQKLVIASKLKLDDDWSLMTDFVVGSLRKLNSLRNKLAHRYGYEVSADDVRELFVGRESMLPYSDALEFGVETGISRYAAFIFGNMLPSFEPIEPQSP
jgi:hypothetical protein